MTEQPFRTNSTHSPHGTAAPFESRASAAYSRPPVSLAETSATPNSRPSIPPPLEQRASTQHQILRTASYLLLAATLVILGWNLLPHDGASTTSKLQSRSLPGSPATFAQSQVNTAPPAVSTFPPVNLPREPDAALREPGLRHIATLQLAGSFAQAADYAVAGPLDYRRDFTIAAFHEWGRHQPDHALAAAIRIEEAFTRDWAVASVFSGWARTDPEGMAETALAFPDSDFKKAALTKALRAWMNKDPQIAGDWIIAHPDVVPIAEEMFRRDRR